VSLNISFSDLAGNAGSAITSTSNGSAVQFDRTAPTASVTTTTITNSGDAVVRSTETGTAYLVKTTVSVSNNLTSITGAADSQWNSVAISSASTNTNLAATGLADGTYKVYAVDAAGNLSSASTNSVTLDTTAPTLSQVTAVFTNNDTTPSYTFSSNEAGTISYGGSCSSSTTSASSGNNNITFNTLSTGTYSNCTINVTDAAGNISNTLTINSFSVGAIILFNQTANYHINGTTPTKTKGNKVASENTCSSSATSLGITESTIGVFATVTTDLKLFVTGGTTSRQVVSINNSLISNTWNELWDGAIDMSLSSAGVVSSSLWWSGSKGDGTKVTAINNNSAGNCYGSSGGAAGMSTATSEISTASGWGYTGNNSRLAEPLRPSWIGKYPDLGCGDELEIVCVAKPNF
jgi:hypothetical protein